MRGREGERGPKGVRLGGGEAARTPSFCSEALHTPHTQKEKNEKKREKTVGKGRCSVGKEEDDNNKRKSVEREREGKRDAHSG